MKTYEVTLQTNTGDLKTHMIEADYFTTEDGYLILHKGEFSETGRRLPSQQKLAAFQSVKVLSIIPKD